jgi:hypothetical protein
MINTARIQRALQTQRARTDTTAATFGRERRVTGSLLIEGIGRTGVEVQLPLWFVNQPAITFGQQLDTNESYNVAIPPSIEATVTRWFTRERGNPDNLLWTGFRLLATTRGRPNQRQILTWAAAGIAIAVPADTLGSIDDSL